MPGAGGWTVCRGSKLPRPLQSFNGGSLSWLQKRLQGLSEHLLPPCFHENIPWFFPASAHWRAGCAVSLLLLGAWHFGTREQKSSSSYSCQVVPSVRTMGGSCVRWGHQKSQERLNYFRNRSYFPTLIVNLALHTTAVCALNGKTACLRKQAVEAWRHFHLLLATDLLPVAFSQPARYHPLDHKWFGELSSLFLAVTNMLLPWIKHFRHLIKHRKNITKRRDEMLVIEREEIFLPLPARAALLADRVSPLSKRQVLQGMRWLLTTN